MRVWIREVLVQWQRVLALTPDLLEMLPLEANHLMVLQLRL